MINPARTTIQSRAPVNGSVAAWEADAGSASVWPLPAAEVATAPGASAPAGCLGLGALGAAVVACDGTGRGCGRGLGAGDGVGEGVGPSQLAPWRWLLSAWTSTSWPPLQGAVLWGWLLPGPCSTAVADDAFPAAI